MKIGLLDIDYNGFPNLALMKISSYYKFVVKAERVEWYNFTERYDRIFVSKIFNFSPDEFHYLPSDQIIKGGTGYDINIKLPNEIEEQTWLDYTIYPTCRFSIQLFSRGCIRNCSFCVVPKKEGKIKPIQCFSMNPYGKHIEVLDNNFFANPLWKEAILELIKVNQPVNFHGIDARILTEENAFYLNKLKHTKQIHIAWDDPKYDMVKKLKEIIKWIKPYKLMCYVLIGFNSTQEQDFQRVGELRKLKIDPFVMPFDKSDNYQNRFARWVNHKAIFKSVNFENYKS